MALTRDQQTKREELRTQYIRIDASITTYQASPGHDVTLVKNFSRLLAEYQKARNQLDSAGNMLQNRLTALEKQQNDLELRVERAQTALSKQAAAVVSTKIQESGISASDIKAADELEKDAKTHAKPPKPAAKKPTMFERWCCCFSSTEKDDTQAKLLTNPVGEDASKKNYGLSG